jgi:hypothetical protein
MTFFLSLGWPQNDPIWVHRSGMELVVTRSEELDQVLQELEIPAAEQSDPVVKEQRIIYIVLLNANPPGLSDMVASPDPPFKIFIEFTLEEQGRAGNVPGGLKTLLRDRVQAKVNNRGNVWRASEQRDHFRFDQTGGHWIEDDSF